MWSHLPKESDLAGKVSYGEMSEDAILATPTTPPNFRETLARGMALMKS